MSDILNLTQHSATLEQIHAGVTAKAPEGVTALLTFNEIPVGNTIADRATAIAEIAKATKLKYAMIGGAPFFMSALENALIERDITPLYAFSVRESVESKDHDGAVVKTAVFRHKGFIQM